MIFQSDIRRLPKDTFSRYANTLVALNLQNCSIKDIDDDAFRGLTHLQKLTLSSNNISEVKDRWFQELMSLQQLDLSYNKITRIESLAFERLSNLRRLDLSENRLGCLESNVLQPLRALDKLRFEGNPLTFQCRAKVNRNRALSTWLDFVKLPIRRFSNLRSYFIFLFRLFSLSISSNIFNVTHSILFCSFIPLETRINRKYLIYLERFS